MMLRFRLGQQWRHESGTADEPRDAFRIEDHTVNLLKGITDEPILRVTIDVAESLLSLTQRGHTAAQLTFESAPIQLSFLRMAGTEVELLVVDSGVRPRVLRGPFRLDLDDLLQAGLALTREVLHEAPRLGSHQAAFASLSATQRLLERAAVRPFVGETRHAWGARGTSKPGLGFWLVDPLGRIRSWNRNGSAGLPSLLFEGGLTLPSGAIEAGYPMLQLLGLARQAAEGPVCIADTEVAPQSIFECGLGLGLVLRHQHPSLANNPYLETLALRCTDGLAAASPRRSVRPPPRPSAPRPTDEAVSGQWPLRRVSMNVKWERAVALGESGARLTSVGRHITVCSTHAAHQFTANGTSQGRVSAPLGVVGLDSGEVMACNDRQLSLIAHGQTQWIRRPDTARLVGPGSTLGDLAICLTEGRGLAAISRATGRTVWQHMPPQTRRSFFTVARGRLLLASDGGLLSGVDALDGAVGFQVKSISPCVVPPVVAGRRGLGVLCRADVTTAFEFDAHASLGGGLAGAVRWKRELSFRSPSLPVWGQGRWFIAGQREGQAVVAAISSKGQLQWQRVIPLRTSGVSLVPFEGGVIAVDRSGAALRLLPDGDADWVSGTATSELTTTIPALLCRQLLVAPGPIIRLIDPRSGRSVGELALGAELVDLQVDRQLTCTAYCEPGRLVRACLDGHLAVVTSASGG